MGHIAIGCSTQGGDTVAPGVATCKIRDSYPNIVLYDSNRNNRKSAFGSADDYTYMRSYKEGGSSWCGVQANYKTGEVTIVNGNFTTGGLLTLDNDSFVRVPTIKGYSAIKVTKDSDDWLDGINNDLIGREIAIYSTTGKIYLKQSNYSYGFRNKSGSDIVMEVGKVYKYIRLDDGWYEL